MGFTPLEGLVMATRSGTVDPGLVLWLADHAGTPPAELAATLEHRSGLLGLAGTADMRAILSRAAGGDEAARLARDVYIHRLRAEIAAMTAALGGLDTLVFTGGVGENSAEVRARAAEGTGFLGVAINEDANAGAHPDADITADGSAVRVLVIAAREDLEIARQVRATLAVLRAAYVRHVDPLPPTGAGTVAPPASRFRLDAVLAVRPATLADAAALRAAAIAAYESPEACRGSGTASRPGRNASLGDAARENAGGTRCRARMAG